MAIKTRKREEDNSCVCFGAMLYVWLLLRLLPIWDDWPAFGKGKTFPEPPENAFADANKEETESPEN